MIDIEKLKTFIDHPDQRVRREVMRYFRTNQIQDSSLLSLALDSCQHYGCDENLFAIYSCDHLYFDYAQAERLWRILKSSNNPLVKMHVTGLLCNAPVPFLEQHIDALKKAGAGQKLKKAKARIKFKDASAKELWTELGDYSRKCSGERVHAGYVEALIDMLLPFEYPAEKELLELLEDEEIAEQWLEVFLVELAAARKLDSAVPIIHRKIHIDDDALAPACLEALGTIGTEEVVTAIVTDFEKQPWHYQLYASAVFERIRSQSSENAVIELLRKKDQIPHDIYCHLCFSLCNMFSEAAFEWGRTIIDDIEALTYDSIKERLIILSTVLDHKLPEKEVWKSQLDSDNERLRTHRNKQLFSTSMLPDDDFGPSGFDQEGYDPTYISNAKVGRNEPCPCGSGKKHKKCCGRMS